MIGTPSQIADGLALEFREYGEPQRQRIDGGVWLTWHYHPQPWRDVNHTRGVEMTIQEVTEGKVTRTVYRLNTFGRPAELPGWRPLAPKAEKFELRKALERIFRG